MPENAIGETTCTWSWQCSGAYYRCFMTEGETIYALCLTVAETTVNFPKHPVFSLLKTRYCAYIQSEYCWFKKKLPVLDDSGGIYMCLWQWRKLPVLDDSGGNYLYLITVKASTCAWCLTVGETTCVWCLTVGETTCARCQLGHFLCLMTVGDTTCIWTTVGETSCARWQWRKLPVLDDSGETTCA